PGPEDEPQPAGVGDQDARGQRLQQIVVVAVAAAGLVADLEAVGQALEDAQDAQHLRDAADLAAAHQLPGLAQDADRDITERLIWVTPRVGTLKRLSPSLSGRRASRSRGYDARQLAIIQGSCSVTCKPLPVIRVV